VIVLIDVLGHHRSMTSIVLIGDVGGCRDRLAAALADAPAGAVVVQVGDLIDRGPDSSGVLALVSGQTRPWVQLIGNHEAQYLGGAAFWPEPLLSADAELLKRWWLTERLRVAVAVRTVDGEELLVTHAGLTVDAWRELGEPVTAATAADLLNTRPEPLLWADHGPLWPEAGPGLYTPWLEAHVPVPFSQVHGHSTIVHFGHRAWTCGERLRRRSTVDWDARRTVTRIGSARFIGIDPKHGRLGAPRWAPLVVEGEIL
jgi:hypothetical protein